MPSSSSSSSPSSPRSTHSPPPASPSPPPSPNMSALVHPAGKRFLMRKSSNTENMPPTITSAGHAKKAEALVSAPASN
ncbi:hypothetical protein NUW54_g5613 [Trametes sanguinea]|uniref:Uncharacterized protein n=1 Tax=Trametes sanguinea TaxID=158606 RepID=A0ACC1PY06_9APHY|nr:hypothetical protein NUW54_g5613 [Trametes sanguinea]